MSLSAWKERPGAAARSRVGRVARSGPGGGAAFGGAGIRLFLPVAGTSLVRYNLPAAARVRCQVLGEK